MAKIIVNGKFLSQRTTGVQRFARELLIELDKICEGYNIEIIVPKDTINIPKYNNIRIIKYGKFKGVLWEQISFPRYVRKQKGISLNLCNSAPLTGKKIVTIHDVKIKAHPEFFNKKFLLWYNYLFKNLIKKSLAIITVSNFSKSEIIKYYNVGSNKITVVYNSWQHYKKINYDEGALKKYSLVKDKYFFAMSSIEPNKNLKWITEVANRNRNLIFAVAGGLNKKIFVEKNLIVPDNLKLLGYISDSEAKTLMRDCFAFLFPTFYEGFGIPPLEALAAGAKNIVVSDTEIMHEIFEDRANYVNPLEYDFDIENIQINRSFQNILDKYSWRKSAENLLDVIKKALGN